MKRFWLVLCCLLPVLAQAAQTQDVFRHFQDRIVQIRILETSSGSRVALGSGFSVSRDGEIVTNYHVISELVQKPKQYRAEIVYFDGSTSPLKLLGFDVIRDLAIVSGKPLANSFELYAPPLAQGTRVFSIGTPFDLGFTIVEGTYNGLLEKSQYEKIHFTGSINPGMSGGPAILEDGRVIGVNVATSGNQVSFLVPAKFVIALLQKTNQANPPAPDHATMASQLLENQQYFMSRLFQAQQASVTLGPYQLPGKIAPYLKCWGNTNRDEDDLYQHLSHFCSSGDDLYISGSHRIRFINLRHDYFASDQLSLRRFYKLYRRNFDDHDENFYAGKEDVTRFKCQTGFVSHNELTLRTVLCVRAYRKLPGLYDAVFKVATLGDDRRGVMSTLELGGVSYDNALHFARSYLDGITWKK